VEKLQFVALSGLLTVPKSTLYLTYARHFFWMIGGYVLPIDLFRPDATTPMDGASQFTRTIGARPAQLIYHLAILFGIFLVALVIGTAIVAVQCYITKT